MGLSTVSQSRFQTLSVVSSETKKARRPLEVTATASTKLVCLVRVAGSVGESRTYTLRA